MGASGGAGNHGGCLQSASLPLYLQYGDLPLNYIFILSAILAAYMICKRLSENGEGSSGVLSAEAPRGPGLGSHHFGPFLCSLPPVASRSRLPPPTSLPALLSLRKSGRVRQLKLPLGADFSPLLWINEYFATKFFTAGAGLCSVAPERQF